MARLTKDARERMQSLVNRNTKKRIEECQKTHGVSEDSEEFDGHLNEFKLAAQREMLEKSACAVTFDEYQTYMETLRLLEPFNFENGIGSGYRHRQDMAELKKEMFDEKYPEFVADKEKIHASQTDLLNVIAFAQSLEEAKLALVEAGINV